MLTKKVNTNLLNSHVKYVTQFRDRVDGEGPPVASMVARCIFDIVKPYLNKSMHLDVGCWTGGFFFLCQSVTVRSIGLDLQLPPLLVAKKYNSEGMFISASVFSLPFQDSSFDIITLSEVIEHLPANSEISALREIGRVLTANGKVFLTTPNMNPLGFWADPAYFFLGHRHYSVDKLKIILDSADFKIISLWNYGGFFQLLNGFLGVLYKYLLRRKFVTFVWVNNLIRKEFRNRKKSWWTSTKVVILAEKIK